MVYKLRGIQVKCSNMKDSMASRLHQAGKEMLKECDEVVKKGFIQ